MQDTLDLDELRLNDLGLAAAIMSLGFELVTCEPTNGKRVIFVFRNHSGIDEIVKRYWSGGLAVDAFSYFGAIKLLKTRLYAISH